MQASIRRCLAGVTLLAVWWTAGSAAAWTDARVRGAHVVVQIDAEGRALVAMDLDLIVRGGWLEGFELSGLSADAVVDSLKPPVLLGADGQKWTPRVRHQESGPLALSFDRKGAPKRGDYRLRVLYRAGAVPELGDVAPEGQARFSWTLPGWQTGLETAEVWVWAPSPRALAVPEEGLSPAQARPTAQQTLLHFSRLHVPRATPWRLGFDVPETDLAPGLLAHRERNGGLAGSGRPGPGNPVSPVCVALGCLLLGAWAQHRASRRAGRGVGRWRGAFGVTVGASAVCLSAAGWWLSGGAQVVAVALAAACGLSGMSRRAEPVRFGDWRRVGAPERARVRARALRGALGLAAPPDPISVLGVALPLTALIWLHARQVSGADSLFWAGSCLAVACGWSPRRWGGGASTGLRRVFQLARRLRRESVGLSVRAFFAAGEALAQPRLVCVPARPVAGLLHLEVAPDQRPGARGFAVLATVVPLSPSDCWLGEFGAERRVSPGARRACHLFAARDVREVDACLGRILDHCARRSVEVAQRAA